MADEQNLNHFITRAYGSLQKGPLQAVGYDTSNGFLSRVNSDLKDSITNDDFIGSLSNIQASKRNKSNSYKAKFISKLDEDDY